MMHQREAARRLPPILMKEAKGMAVYTFGYARVSTKDQHLDRQLIKFRELGIHKDRTFTDEQSGKSFDRKGYQKLRAQVREGDLIYFDALDRLGRDYDGIIAEWKYLTREVKCDIVVLENESLFDSRKYRVEVNAMGPVIEDIILALLAWLAAAERMKNQQRSEEGRAAARLRGVRFGAPKIEADEKFAAFYKLVKAGEMTATDAWTALGWKKATWYRRVGEQPKESETELDPV